MHELIVRGETHPTLKVKGTTKKPSHTELARHTFVACVLLYLLFWKTIFGRVIFTFKYKITRQDDGASIQNDIINDKDIVVAVAIIITISLASRQPNLKAGMLFSLGSWWPIRDSDRQLQEARIKFKWPI